MTMPQIAINAQSYKTLKICSFSEIVYSIITFHQDKKEAKNTMVESCIGSFHLEEASPVDESPSSPSNLEHDGEILSKERSEAKLRKLLGPISFNLREPTIAEGHRPRRFSTVSRELSVKKLKAILGPVSFNLETPHKTQVPHRS